MERQIRGKTYKRRTPAGHEYTVYELTQDDVEDELAEFEERYGMTSQEFIVKWKRGELDCAVGDYFSWYGACRSAATWGRVNMDVEVIRKVA